jgi:hypothetical protein
MISMVSRTAMTMTWEPTRTSDPGQKSPVEVDHSDAFHHECHKCHTWETSTINSLWDMFGWILFLHSNIGVHRPTVGWRHAPSSWPFLG